MVRLKEQFATTQKPKDNAMVLGGFNIAPEDADVWDIKKFANSTHVTPAERARWQSCASGAWSTCSVSSTQDRLYTYWDYRAGDFHMHRGVRIDLAYATAPVAEKVTWAIVDRQARKGKLPFDHTPLIVDIDL